MFRADACFGVDCLLEAGSLAWDFRAVRRVLIGLMDLDLMVGAYPFGHVLLLRHASLLLSWSRKFEQRDLLQLT